MKALKKTFPRTLQPGQLTVGVDAAPPLPLHSGYPGEGFEVDLLADISRRLNVQLRYRGAPWSEILSELASHKLDLVCSAATITEARREFVDFGRPYFDLDLAVVVKDAAPIRAPEELLGGKVAVRIATTAEEFLRTRAQPRAIVTFHMNADAYMVLEAGRVEAVVDDSPIAKWFQGSVAGLRLAGILEGTGAQYAMVFAKGNDALREAIDQALAAVEADGAYASIYDRWFAGASLTACPEQGWGQLTYQTRRRGE